LSAAGEPRSNVEVKASCADLDKAREAGRSAGAQFARVEHQRDTYFRCNDGRLKLRQIETKSGRRAEMIFYCRADAGGPRLSRYSLKKVRFPNLKRRWLRLTRGITVEVVKTRELWLWRGVRIHLDRVVDLGDYLELEAVVGDIGDEEEARRRCEILVDRLGIKAEDQITTSYSDLISGRRSG